MAHEATTPDLAATPRGAEVPRSLVLFGVALPIAFVAFNLAVIGLVGLVTGRMEPIPSLAMTLLGSAATWLVGRRAIQPRT